MYRPVRQQGLTLGVFTFVSMLGVVVGTLALSVSRAGAVENTCRSKNVTQGTPSLSNLQSAINAAHRGDRISVKGVCVGSFTDLTLVGHRKGRDSKPVLRGDGAWDRVLRVAGKVTLSNLTVTGGRAGGILLRKGGILTLNRSVIRGNSSNHGGGIANYGRLVPERLVLSAQEHGGRGRGIFLDTFKHGLDPTLTMNDSASVRGNQATDVGGGILVNRGTVTLKNSSSVSGNRVSGSSSPESGGGIAVQGGGTLVMRHSSSVSENRAPRGGGISTGPRWATVTMDESSSLHGNIAELGGGIFNLGTITMNDSASVTSNGADSGGGITNQGILVMNDSSTVSGNTAEGTGGGIVHIGTASLNGSVILKDLSGVYDNTAALSGGIHLVEDRTINACDGTSADEWIGTVEPNDPNDFLDSDVVLIPSGAGACS